MIGLYFDFYAHLRIAILSSDPLHSLDRAYYLVIDYERVRLAHATPDDKPTVVWASRFSPEAMVGPSNSLCVPIVIRGVMRWLVVSLY